MLTVYTNALEGETTVSFTLIEDEENVYLDLYDLNGVKVNTLYAGEANAEEEYKFSFDSESVPATELSSDCWKVRVKVSKKEPFD
jgi:hypothetical protein